MEQYYLTSPKVTLYVTLVMAKTKSLISLLSSLYTVFYFQYHIIFVLKFSEGWDLLHNSLGLLPGFVQTLGANWKYDSTKH